MIRFASQIAHSRGGGYLAVVLFLTLLSASIVKTDEREPRPGVDSPPMYRYVIDESEDTLFLY